MRELLSHSQGELATRYDYKNIVGRSDVMRRVLHALDRITATDVSVLIEGESGTGKELIARALHANGPRGGAAFVGENCGAVPETLLESILFGHVKGAFTGAGADRKGLFELAHRGTLFLDEVGEMSAAMQVKLLRALQEGEVRRLGASAPVKVDVRVIAATNRDLKAEVAAGRFREDLFYRLNVVRVVLPPLRERREDIPLLAQHFMAKLRRELGKGPGAIADDAMARLARHPWPGNIRELENVLKNAFVMAETARIHAGDLGALPAPEAPRRPAPTAARGRTIAEGDAEAIRTALERAGGKVAPAAAALGMPLRTLYYKLSKLGLARRGPRT